MLIRTPSSAGIDAFVDTALDTLDMAVAKSERKHEIFIRCILSCLFINIFIVVVVGDVKMSKAVRFRIDTEKSINKRFFDLFAFVDKNIFSKFFQHRVEECLWNVEKYVK